MLDVFRGPDRNAIPEAQKFQVLTKVIRFQEISKIFRKFWKFQKLAYLGNQISGPENSEIWLPASKFSGLKFSDFRLKPKVTLDPGFWNPENFLAFLSEDFEDFKRFFWFFSHPA